MMNKEGEAKDFMQLGFDDKDLVIRVFQNASKSKFQGGGLPKLAIIPN